MKAKKENKLGSTTDGEGNDLNGRFFKRNFFSIGNNDDLFLQPPIHL